MASSLVQASTTLLNLVESWADTYLNSSELVKKILIQAHEEDISNDKLRTIIEQALTKKGLSDRQIRRALPDELKNQNMVRNSPKVEKFADMMSAKSGKEKITLEEEREVIEAESDQEQDYEEEQEEESAVAQWKKAAEERTKIEQDNASKIEELAKQLKELQEKLSPFTTTARCFVKDTEFVFNVEVDPATQKVFLEINEKAMMSSSSMRRALH